MEQQKPQALTQEEIQYIEQKLGWGKLKDLKRLNNLKEDGFTLDDIVEALEFL